MKAFDTPIPEHTPGPWAVMSGHGCKDIGPKDVEGIKGIHGIAGTFGVTPESEDKANGLIMAASPEMYRGGAALMEILYELIEEGRIDWSVDDAPFIHGWLEYTDCALAKARGES